MAVETKQHLVPAAARLVGEGLGEVALAHAGRPVEQDVLVPVHELAGGEVEDLGLVQLGVEAEVEALEGLRGIEGRPAEAEPERGLGPPLHLVLEQQGEELDERAPALDRLAVAHVQGRQDPGEPERAEHGGELRGQFHGGPPSPPGSGKKSVQGRAWRGKGAAGAGTRREVEERLPIEARRQDGLHRGIAVLPHRTRSGAGRFQPGRAVPLGEAEDALRAAQAIEGPIAEERGDERGAGRADRGRLLLAPAGRLEEEVDLVRGQVIVQGPPLAGARREVARDQRVGVEALDLRAGGPDPEPLPDQAGTAPSSRPR